MRPGIFENIKFKLFEDENWKKGRVLRVGKASGRNKHCCWIKNDAEAEKKINFAHDVENWEYVPNVTFNEVVHEKMYFINNDEEKSNSTHNIFS